MKHSALYRRCGLFLLVGALATALRAEPEGGTAWIRGIYTGKSPRVIALPVLTAWQRANEFSGGELQSIVVVGTGVSMQPLYPSGTLLVLCRTSFAELQSGQTVVYRNKSHQTVAHVLIARTNDGWRVAGLNNRTHDMEPVQEENLIGVVVAAYRPLADETVGTRIAAQ